MYNGFNTIGLIEQVEQHHSCDNTEEYGQRHGRPVHLPRLRDRIALRVGAILIHIGEKMTAASEERASLSEEIA